MYDRGEFYHYPKLNGCDFVGFLPSQILRKLGMTVERRAAILRTVLQSRRGGACSSRIYNPSMQKNLYD